ncbi:hypothetical protein PR048_018142 [Dryococelus australis]|uniref:Uncharacterized protein n=1 Tax=Dryococelus australis TaxID=614101 RepID=A0ABQ9HBG0_9NEOP|nr:hypothetical protein PR048_018142 [Dryococelus australis]
MYANVCGGSRLAGGKLLVIPDSIRLSQPASQPASSRAVVHGSHDRAGEGSGRGQLAAHQRTRHVIRDGVGCATKLTEFLLLEVVPRQCCPTVSIQRAAAIIGDLSADSKRKRGRGGVVVRAYSPPTKANRVRFPAGSLPGFSHVGIVPDDVVNQRVFSGIPRFPRSSLLTLHSLASLTAPLLIPPATVPDRAQPYLWGPWSSSGSASRADRIFAERHMTISIVSMRVWTEGGLVKRQGCRRGNCLPRPPADYLPLPLTSATSSRYERSGFDPPRPFPISGADILAAMSPPFWEARERLTAARLASVISPPPLKMPS